MSDKQDAQIRKAAALLFVWDLCLIYILFALKFYRAKSKFNLFNSSKLYQVLKPSDKV